MWAPASTWASASRSTRLKSPAFISSARSLRPVGLIRSPMITNGRSKPITTSRVAEREDGVGSCGGLLRAGGRPRPPAPPTERAARTSLGVVRPRGGRPRRRPPPRGPAPQGRGRPCATPRCSRRTAFLPAFIGGPVDGDLEARMQHRPCCARRPSRAIDLGRDVAPPDDGQRPGHVRRPPRAAAIDVAELAVAGAPVLEGQAEAVAPPGEPLPAAPDRRSGRGRPAGGSCRSTIGSSSGCRSRPRPRDDQALEVRGPGSRSGRRCRAPRRPGAANAGAAGEELVAVRAGQPLDALAPRAPRSSSAAGAAVGVGDEDPVVAARARRRIFAPNGGRDAARAGCAASPAGSVTSTFGESGRVDDRDAARERARRSR